MLISFLKVSKNLILLYPAHFNRYYFFVLHKILLYDNNKIDKSCTSSLYPVCLYFVLVVNNQNFILPIILGIDNKKSKKWQTGIWLFSLMNHRAKNIAILLCYFIMEYSILFNGIDIFICIIFCYRWLTLRWK